MWCIRNCTVIRNFMLHRPKLDCQRYLNSKIPAEPFELCDKVNNCRTKIDKDTIAHLERLSLVDFGNEKGIKILEDAIAFADQLETINTEGIQPLFTVLEDSELRLRDDRVTDGNCRSKILSNAAITEEDYFVAPPGNIPLAPKHYSDSVGQDSNSEIFKKKVKKTGS